jgi:hypothetical protein
MRMAARRSICGGSGWWEKNIFIEFRNFCLEVKKRKSYVQILKVSVVIMMLPKLNLYCNEVEISIDGIQEQIVWGIFTL